MREDIVNYCACIGADPLLVQGAGGNISWKEGDVLWIKASGMWLADARNKDIFIPVTLSNLQKSIVKNEFNAKPEILSNSSLRPSIETMLHALFSHKIVVHLHVVDILAHLVRHDAESIVAQKMGLETNWVMTAYHKPGAELAFALKLKLSQNPSANIAFLQNHGVILGGQNVEEVCAMLTEICKRFKVKVDNVSTCVVDTEIVKSLSCLGYKPVQLSEVHTLTKKHALFNQLQRYWALYPDHVVFLGSSPALFHTVEAAVNFLQKNHESKAFIFIKGVGVFGRETITDAEYAYLRCYYNIIMRQPPDAQLICLPQDCVNELLDWDAEKYRQKLHTTVAA